MAGAVSSIDEVAPDVPRPRLCVKLWSFGFQHGRPGECLIVHNVRHLISPARSVRKGTGLDRRFRKDFVKLPAVSAFLDGFQATLAQQIETQASELARMDWPAVVPVGEKAVGIILEYATFELNIGIGCEQGKHRSVSCVHLMREALAQQFKAEPLRTVWLESISDVHRDVRGAKGGRSGGQRDRAGGPKDSHARGGRKGAKGRRRHKHALYFE